CRRRPALRTGSDLRYVSYCPLNEVRSMNRLTTGMVTLLALLVAAGCSGDPTGSLRGDTARIDAAPSQLFLELGESKSVDVTAVDDQGNQISSVYEVTATDPGIAVRRDSTFLPQYGNDST